MCAEICDGAGVEICDGAPSTCSSLIRGSSLGSGGGSFFLFCFFNTLQNIKYSDRPA